MDFSDTHSKEIKILFDVISDYIVDKYDFKVNSLDDIKIKSRKKPIVIFRRMMMTILGEVFSDNCTQSDIASVVGLDRTSLIHHYKSHANDYSLIKSYREEYDKIKNLYLEKEEIN